MKTIIPLDYQPNDEVLQRLRQAGVDKDFAKSLVPEFVIYWRERQYEHHSWSAKFLQHAMYEWRRYEVMLAQGRAMIKMHSDWQPIQTALVILANQGISAEFALACLPEFRLYWTDRGEVSNTWNNRFIGNVRYRWQTDKSQLLHSVRLQSWKS